MAIKDLRTKIERINIKNNSFLIVKVGSEDRPATEEDLKYVEEALHKVLDNKFPDLPIIVTLHNLDVKLYTCK